MINFLEKAIAAFSPEWACKRAYFRENYENYMRNYEAGDVNRFNDTWVPINADTENVDKTQRDIIKARARDLENNNDIANAAISAFVRNVVGTGIKPQARTQDEKLNTQLERLWREWVKHKNCDITQAQTFYEMQATIVRRLVVDGEILMRTVVDKRAHIPLRLQLIKSDLLDNNLLYAPKTNNVIRSGIELNSYLTPLAYWLQRKSPDGYLTFESERVPAEMVLHLWHKRHPDQIRGISMLASTIKRLKDTQDYLDAETVTARLAACFSIFVLKDQKTPVPALGTAKADKENKKLSSIRPGMISYLRPGEDIKTANPSRSVSGAKDFVDIQERLTASGLGLSYELLSRDFKQSSFSAARQGHEEDKRTFEPIQDYVIAHLCAPVWDMFVEMCVLTGLVNIPDFSQNRAAYTAAEWVVPGWSYIDPSKETDADIKLLANGGKTLAEWCIERGKDWREQLEQIKREREYAEELDITLPIHKPESIQAAEANHKDEKEE